MSQFRQQDNLLGQSDSFLSVLDQVSQLASLEKPVLIIGERGTGKELIAARLHYLSERWDQNYVKLNCAALNENLLEIGSNIDQEWSNEFHQRTTNGHQRELLLFFLSLSAFAMFLVLGMYWFL